ncbi:hypothetical protein ACFXG4_08500 [Nocardia sp. NPDC059246]|uniref:hypothetical protein n=1 Tax=unclassified Nocardia TaxID=2637762 RepID=UPI0036A34D19
MQKYVTRKGATIHTGQHYEDARPTNKRTLHVDSIGEPRDPREPDELTVYTSVIAVDGEPVTRRTTSMTARRLTGRDFVLVTKARKASA